MPHLYYWLCRYNAGDSVDERLEGSAPIIGQVVQGVATSS